MGVVSGNLSINSAFSQVPPGLPVPSGQTATPAVTIPLSGKFNPTNGTAADQVDLKYTNTLTFVASTPQVLTLNALTDIFGAAVPFARIKSIVIVMRGAADGVVLKLGSSGTVANSWVSLVSNPGQIFLQAAPTSGNSSTFVITAPNTTGYVVGTSNKLLNLDPGTAAFSIDIEITGCSV